MKIVPLLLLCLFINWNVFSQEIVNFVLVGDKGATENIKEAHSFIVVKKYPDGFKRLDYKIGAPLQTFRSYTDSTLTILQGSYYEYSLAGTVAKSGYYLNNLKEKDWYYYNDTGKVILEEKYEQGILVKTINPDTVKKVIDSLHDGVFDKVEKEATFKKGDKSWKKYLSENLNGDVAAKSVNGGEVRVGFVVNKTGTCVDIYLRKSVEFVLDEEAIRVIENSPLWQPAYQNGRVVNAYRVQPITFVKQ